MSQPSNSTSTPTRLVSLDAYRGAIMLILAASGFGIGKLATLPESAPLWDVLDRDAWSGIWWCFQHPQWLSQFSRYGVSPWDLIQPAFMFMVGVAMPFSFARREMFGQSQTQRHFHALIRAVVLVLLGVFLQSQRSDTTNWIFTNVLAQIGLGYFFVYLLLPTRWTTKIAVSGLVLIGYWLFFNSYAVPANYDYAAAGVVDTQPDLQAQINELSDEREALAKDDIVADVRRETLNHQIAQLESSLETARRSGPIFSGDFAPWSKNANIGHRLELKLLNALPRKEEFKYNAGGYVTLNFVPSIVTMLLGALCGGLLLSESGRFKKLLLLLLLAAVCYCLGVIAGEYVCPIVKRIWTPSWTLFSGGFVIALLAVFYFLFDILPLRKLAFPLVVVGMNSLLMYMMGQLLRPWTVRQVKTHFGGLLEYCLPGALDDQMWGIIVGPTCAVIVFWLIAFWLYRQKIFLRV